MSRSENIVIVGVCYSLCSYTFTVIASAAGTSLANALVPSLPGTHRILLIDALTFSFWPIGSLRAAVIPGWENRVVGPLNSEAFFIPGSRHEVIPGNKVVELREGSVVLEKSFEGSTEVPFFRCIIATGATQRFPMRPKPGVALEDHLSALKKMQGDFQQAKKVVIIGAGPVGLEIAGDIKAHGKRTQSVTLVHNGPHVLNPEVSSAKKAPSTDMFSYNNPPTAMKLSTTLELSLKELGIDFIPNESVQIPSSHAGTAGSGVRQGEWAGVEGLQDGLKQVKLSSGKVLEADYVFVGIGNKPNVSLVEKADPGALVAGLVAVNQYLKVISKTSESPLTRSYYAIGDCCSAPGWKNYQGADAEGHGCAINVLADILGKAPKAFVRPKPFGMVIPLGSQRGAGTLDLPFLGEVLLPLFMVKMAKGQKLLVENSFAGRFKGPQKPTLPGVPT